jgi:hypothetical protein
MFSIFPSSPFLLHLLFSLPFSLPFLSSAFLKNLTDPIFYLYNAVVPAGAMMPSYVLKYLRRRCKPTVDEVVCVCGWMWLWIMGFVDVWREGWMDIWRRRRSK